MKALILIGLQIDLFPLGATEVAGSEAILAVIGQWLPKFDEVVAARFAHPADHKMFVANYPWRRPGQIVKAGEEEILLKNYYCIKDSFGAEPVEGFDHGKISHTVWMGTQKDLLPRSAFFDENKKRDTGLNDYLNQKNIQEVYLAGVPLEEIIAPTALDAAALGYTVYIIEKATAGRNHQKVETIKKELVEKKIGMV